MTPGQIARVCHEANRALQIAQADPTIPVSPHWEEDTEEQQASCTAGVENALNGVSPAESHAAWCAFKTAHGWQRGPVKDVAALEHPLLVPYEELPASQKLKDALFLAICAVLG